MEEFEPMPRIFGTKDDKQFWCDKPLQEGHPNYKQKENTFEKISIALSPEILKKLDEGNYNKSKLIDKLLTEYFKKEKSQGEALKEYIQDLNTMTEEQNSEIQKRFNQVLEEELSKPENKEFLGKWNENGSIKEEKKNPTFTLTWKNAENELPKEGGRYWCIVGEVNDLGVSYYQWNCVYTPNEGWSEVGVVWWTELAPYPF